MHTNIWPKLGITLTLSSILFLVVSIFRLLYSWQYCPYILYALLLAVVPLYFVHYINSSTAFIFCTLYSWKWCSYISNAIFIAPWSLCLLQRASCILSFCFVFLVWEWVAKMPKKKRQIYLWTTCENLENSLFHQFPVISL